MDPAEVTVCPARPLEDEKITIAEILSTVDDVSRRDDMPEGTGAQLWVHLSNRIYDYLDSITLSDAIESMSDTGKESGFGSGFQQTAA